MPHLAVRGGSPVRTTPFPSWPVFGDEERRRLLEVFDSGRWWYGEKVREFEQAFARFQDAEYGAACTNGTAALEMALFACGVKAGDEVIVPAYTFIATATAVLMLNAVPVFADIDIDTCNLDPADVERKITSRTKAVVPVHFGGLPADMDALGELCRRHGLRLVEDACHSWGSKWNGKGTGAIGDCGAFSFQMSKNITAGEGGILLSDREDVAETARSYSNIGRRRSEPFYEHFVPGTNLRMTELQAAILLGQLTRLEEQTVRRERNARRLDEGLSGIPGIIPQKKDPRASRRAYHMYLFRFASEEWDGLSRESFIEALVAEGVPAGAGYPKPVYRNPLFQRTGAGPEMCPVSCPFHGSPPDYRLLSLPNAERICKEAVWIMHPALLAEEREMDDIVCAVAKIREHRHELRQ